MRPGPARYAWSAALYRLLTLAYPRRFRARFGLDLAADFHDLLAARTAGRPLLGRLEAWRITLLDLLRSVPREHLERVRRWHRGYPRPAGADVDPLVPRSADIMLNDLRVALRNLVRQPGFAFLALLTLALGIGASTATFSVLHAVLLRPLPYKDPERLVRFWNDHTKIGWSTPSVSGSDFVDYREQTTAFESFAILGVGGASLTGEGDPERIARGRMSANLPAFLGLQPLLGRGFATEEDVPEGPAVALLGHELWQRRFGGDPAVLGRSVELDGRAFTVVGVLPAQMRLFLPGGSAPERVDVWIPLQQDLQAQPRNQKWATALARLKPGVTLAEAQAEMDVLAAKLRDNFETHSAAGMQIEVHSLHEDLVRDVRQTLLLLLGGVAFVLLIACANVANLLLARAASREREMAVRTALGARRSRIVRMVLTEGLLLAVLGGALGLMLARWGIEGMLALRPANLPRVDEIAMDPLVLGFALLLCLLTPVLIGLAPALYAARTNVNLALHGGSRGVVGGGGQRLGRVLVIGEVALSLILPIGAVLLLQTFGNLQRLEPGFQPQGVWTAWVPLPRSRYPEDGDRLRFYEQLDERLKALPGVEAAGLGSGLPLSGEIGRGPYADDPRAEISISEFRKVQRASDRLILAPGFDAALGIQLLAGRLFTEQDDLQHPRVIIVDETLARKVWPGQSAIGKRLLISWDPKDLWMEVVGVVRHMRVDTLRADGLEQIYFPLRQVPIDAVAIALRSTSDPAAMTALVRGEVAALDPLLPLAQPQTLEAALADHLAPMRFTLLLVSFFATVAVLLAVVGLYGVLAYSVSLRTREIGLRMALGARPWGVTAMVLRQGMRMAGLGIGLGLLGAVGMSRLLSSLLFGVEPTDAATYALVAAALGLVTAVAVMVPAARAAQVDPKIALLGE